MFVIYIAIFVCGCILITLVHIYMYNTMRNLHSVYNIMNCEEIIWCVCIYLLYWQHYWFCGQNHLYCDKFQEIKWNIKRSGIQKTKFVRYFLGREPCECRWMLWRANSIFIICLVSLFIPEALSSICLPSYIPPIT